MKKVLIVELVSFDSDHANFRIVKQSHRTSNFGIEKSSIFKSLESSSYPEYRQVHGRKGGTAVFYVWGATTTRNNELIYMPLSKVFTFLRDVAMYNEYDFQPKKHTIVIDGKKVEISGVSCENLKKSLCK